MRLLSKTVLIFIFLLSSQNLILNAMDDDFHSSSIENASSNDANGLKKFPELNLDYYPCPGNEALQQLNETQLYELAEYYKLSVDQLINILKNDSSLWVEEYALLYMDNFPTYSDGEEIDLINLEIPLEDTFKLHSKAGSKKVIHLDFDGYTLTPGHRHSPIKAPPRILEPFNNIGLSDTFTDDELRQIQLIWQMVAEDFAAFDIDVTTEDPGYDALYRTDLSDDRYGVSAVITDTFASPFGFNAEAVTDSFATIGPNKNIFGPALIYSRAAIGPRFIYPQRLAEFTSHELGHTLGLNHHGQTPNSEYYNGHADWAPIMGRAQVGFLINRNLVSQWSKAEYANPSNPGQNDYQRMITVSDVSLRADDHSNFFGNATELLPSTQFGHIDGTNSNSSSPSSIFDNSLPIDSINRIYNTDARGIIERDTDIDMFKFSTSGGLLSLDFLTVKNFPNLDIEVKLYKENIQGPFSALPNSYDLILTKNDPNDMSATISRYLEPGTYYISLDGVGKGDPMVDGYTDYGSRGFYRIKGTLPPPLTAHINN
ncbi:MAG: hypothetical protein HRT47_05115 [Candidatus Caenarcaniphilales bacterium]|nr:hypothetical protein [Candidatus Caenarcaniphilales bacterium]